jgi:hypothetical protein
MDTSTPTAPVDFPIAPLRAGLRVAPVEGERFVNVQNEQGKFFRLPQSAMTLLGSISGPTTAHAFVAGLAAEKRGAALALLSHAARVGLLALEQAPEAAPKAPRNLLFFELASFDPSVLLRFVAPLYRLLFSRFGALALVVATAVTVWQAIDVNAFAFQQFAAFRDFTNWPWIYAMLALSSLLHELGHAYACTRHGVKTGRMSIALYFFQVTTYVNVSEAWLCPRRAQKVEIALAGLYVEAFLAVVSAQALIHLDPYTLPSEVSLIFLVILLTRMAFNSLPVLRLDGYWLLSDWLGEHNLRARASAYVLSRLIGVWRPVRLAFKPRHVPAYWLFFSLSTVLVAVVMLRVALLLDGWMSGLWLGWRLLAVFGLAMAVLPLAWSYFAGIRRTYLLD